MSWDDFRSVSLDEPVNNGPWDSHSASAFQTRQQAPQPTSPLVAGQQAASQQQQAAANAIGRSRHGSDDVVSIISSLTANSNIFGGLGSGAAQAHAATGGSSSNAANFDEAVVSDSGSDLFNQNSSLKDALSAISAPVGGVGMGLGSTHSTSSPGPGGVNNSVSQAGYSQSRLASNLFGSASVAGVSVSKFGNNPSLGSSNFFEKFASVTDKTRELERSLNKLTMTDTSAVATAGAAGDKQQQQQQQHAHSQPQPQPQSQQHSQQTTPANGNSRRSSIFQYESVNVNARKPSFSDKFDTYISTTSPSNSRHLSFSSDRAGSDHGSSIALDDQQGSVAGGTASTSGGPANPAVAPGIWNPANATSFFPASVSIPSGAPQYGGQYGGQFGGMIPPPFMMAPPNGYVPQMYPSMPPGAAAGATPSTGVSAPAADRDGSSDGSQSPSAKANFFRPGLARPMSPYMSAPFNPYAMGAPPPQPPHATAPGASQGPVHVRGSPESPDKSGSAAGAALPQNGNSPKLGGRGGKGGRVSKPKKHIVRSPLLEEFRSNKSGKQYTLKDIFGHGYEFSKDQHGSRFIQQQLVSSSDEDKEVIFNEIRNYAIDLMTDVFGNYVIQKYFEHGTAMQRQILFESMRGNFNFLSLQMYGCRVVQKCLESVPEEDQLSIIDELRPNILSLVKDQNGNHVIQKVIECVPTSKTPFILDSLKHQIYHLSTHPYGCRVIQRLLEYSEAEDRDYILGELKGFIYYLVQDQFGNYVIQHIIEHGDAEYKDLILQIVVENLVELSKHKFASNAVEKCIIHQTAANREKVYEALLNGNTDKEAPLDENSALSMMMKDPFANYVVQKMVELVDGPRRVLLIAKIRQYLELITKTSTSSKHLASIDKLIAITQRY